MDINSIDITFFKKGGFESVENEGSKISKVLPYLSIVQSNEGSYDISIGNGQMEHTGNGGFFVAPSGLLQNITHHVNKESGTMSARWIFINVLINNTHKLDSLYNFPTIVTGDCNSNFTRAFERIFESNNIWENYSDCYKLLGILIDISSPTKKEPHLRIENAVSYICEHYMEQLTIKQLAKLSNMSESNFYAVFKKHMGKSPIVYLNNYRLSIAVDRLLDTTESISEISYGVGINDPLYFSKLFKRTYGMSPKEFRMTYLPISNTSSQ